MTAKTKKLFKADIARAIMADRIAEGITDRAVIALEVSEAADLSPTLAKTYVKNNWAKAVKMVADRSVVETDSELVVAA